MALGGQNLNQTCIPGPLTHIFTETALHRPGKNDTICSFSERIANFFGDFVPNVMDFFSRVRQPPSKVLAGYQLKAGREGKREIRREVSLLGYLVVPG